MSAVCERKRAEYLPPFFSQRHGPRDTRHEPLHRHENSTSRHRSLPSHAYAAQAQQPCKEICRSDSKVWSKKKRKTPSSLKISTPFRRSASALFSSHRLQLECPSPTSASRGSEQNQKG